MHRCLAHALSSTSWIQNFRNNDGVHCKFIIYLYIHMCIREASIRDSEFSRCWIIHFAKVNFVFGTKTIWELAPRYWSIPSQHYLLSSSLLYSQTNILCKLELHVLCTYWIKNITGGRGLFLPERRLAASMTAKEDLT